MVNYISILVFVLVAIVGGALAGAVMQASPGTAGLLLVAWLILDIIVSAGIKMASQ